MRLSERLKWIFAGLFLLCGVPLLFLDQENPDPTAAHALAGSAVLFLGGFALCLAWNAWETGVINIQHFNFSRAGQPRRFTATVAVILLAGCSTITTAFWFFFFK